MFFNFVIIYDRFLFFFTNLLFDKNWQTKILSKCNKNFVNYRKIFKFIFSFSIYSNFECIRKNNLKKKIKRIHLSVFLMPLLIVVFVFGDKAYLNFEFNILYQSIFN